MQKARIPRIARILYPKAVCRIPVKGKKNVYLTFDDGPVPEATPLVLDILKEYNAKATFFCVGDNVKKYPELYERIKREGHAVGNHTYNHVNGWKKSTEKYIKNIGACAEVVNSKLFRPPYGRMTLKQYGQLNKEYHIVLWDVLSMDYEKERSAESCLFIVEKYTRTGSIIVFHDSIKAREKIPFLLPKTLEFLGRKGYLPETITVAE